MRSWGSVRFPRLWGIFAFHTVESLFESSSCGTGLSGDYLSEEGHYWVGIDISLAMLGKYVLFGTGVDYPHEYGAAMHIVCFLHLLFCDADAALDREAQGDLLLGDMGQGIPFKPGSFDGCIR